MTGVERGRRHAAVSDCEEVRPGWLGQPANALSSLAFVAAAVPIWRVSRRPGRRAWGAVAAASAFEGLGSVLYHGPGTASGKVVHDIGLVALVAASVAVAVDDPASARPTPLAASLTAAAVAMHVLSRTGGPLCSCRSPIQGHALFHVLAAAATVAAAEGR
jgi:hypothetical protein